jgi:hypothetical protein
MSRLASKRFRVSIGFFALLAAMSLACVADVEGDRVGEDGTCPEGETCLRFHSSGAIDLRDGTADRLGPVLAGGTLDVAFEATDGSELPAIAADDSLDIFAILRGDGTFGLPDENGEHLPYETFVTLQALEPGASSLHILSRETGEIIDSTTIEAVTLEELRIVTPGERDYVYAGCWADFDLEMRTSSGATWAYDEAMTATVGGAPTDQRMLVWFRQLSGEVAADASEIVVEVTAAGRTFSRTFDVRSLAEDRLTTCP